MSGYVDGDLGAVARRRLAHHLSECHECRALLGSLQQLLGALGRAAALDTAEPAPQIAVAVLARLDEPA
jgi:anti-sigma factor RsiW